MPYANIEDKRANRRLYQPRAKELKQKLWRENPEKAREQNRKGKRTDRARHPIRHMLETARKSSKRRGWPKPTITEKELLLPDGTLPQFCPVFGIPLTYNDASGKRPTDNSASLDRVDSTKWYDTGNGCIVSWRANRLKSCMSADEIRALARYVTERGL